MVDLSSTNSRAWHTTASRAAMLSLVTCQPLGNRTPGSCRLLPSQERLDREEPPILAGRCWAANPLAVSRHPESAWNQLTQHKSVEMHGPNRQPVRRVAVAVHSADPAAEPDSPTHRPRRSAGYPARVARRARRSRCRHSPGQSSRLPPTFTTRQAHAASDGSWMKVHHARLRCSTCCELARTFNVPSIPWPARPARAREHTATQSVRVSRRAK